LLPTKGSRAVRDSLCSCNTHPFVGENMDIFATILQLPLSNIPVTIMLTLLSIIVLIPTILKGQMKDNTHILWLSAGCISFAIGICSPLILLSIGPNAGFITIPMLLLATSPQGRMLLVDMVMIPRSMWDATLERLHRVTEPKASRYKARRETRELLSKLSSAKENYHC